jgi:hypothetical protein
MTNPVIQSSFNSGEWTPSLYGRVDLQKYHSGAALIRNFFVDYRGGATTRPGTRFVQRARNTTFRLIPFVASFSVTYVLEFGPGYVRFYYQGSPVTETPKTITSATSANPGVFTSTAHGYVNGDWILLTGFPSGWTSLNGNWYIITAAAANTFQLTDLYGNAISTLGFPAFSGTSSAQRHYTLTNSPYQITDNLFQIKYAQDVNTLILCHPNYPPYQLVLTTATSWTLSAINFGATISAPTGLSSSTSTGTGNWVQYVVTAVDANGQESGPSATQQQQTQFLTSPSATVTLSWAVVTGAVSYNVYRTIVSTIVSIPAGVPFGFIGNVTGTSIIDTNIAPDFSISEPVVENPFSGNGVATVTMTAAGNYTTVPSVTFTTSPGTTAQGAAFLSVQSIASIFYVGIGYSIGQIINFGYGITVQVTAIGGSGTFASGVIKTGGSFSGGVGTPFPANPLVDLGNTAGGVKLNFTWGVGGVTLTSPGAGYLSAPGVTFGAGGSGAAATTTLGSNQGNPTVPGFVQQRLFLGGQVLSPSQFNMSQPTQIYNFNITFPAQADNAIQATLFNTTLNSIKSVVPVSAGLIIFADHGAWLVNGGSPGAPISALQLVANPQAYSGASDVAPIVTPNDILYVQAKNSSVRDLAYNFYLANYVGADVSIISSHLFYDFTIIQWTWAEEPFKVAWAVRSDGQLLSFTFVKDQELLAWAHHDTNGAYSTICSVNESTLIGNVDAVYVGVQRFINNQAVAYIERMVELIYPNDFQSSWQVDAGIGYTGNPATTFSGAQHLAGQAVTGVADGIVINFTMPISGTFIFGPGGTPGLTGIPSASIVTVGLAFLPQFQTLPLDLGEPTVQGKRKTIRGVNLRCRQTLGLQIGRSFSTLVPMQDLTLGSQNVQMNQQVTGLVTGDARTIVDPQWDVWTQYCVQQPSPYPATILAVMPEIDVGDDAT